MKHRYSGDVFEHMIAEYFQEKKTFKTIFFSSQVLVHKYIDWIQAITGIAFGAIFG